LRQKAQGRQRVAGKPGKATLFLSSGLYRWYGSSTHSADFRRVADFTASGELHPALKQTC